MWFAQLNENFNVSLPWVQVKQVKIRESKYGVALVLETSKHSGSYVLGFRVQDIDTVYDELCSMFLSYRKKPVFGVQCQFDLLEEKTELVAIPKEEDEMEIVATGYETVDRARNTYAEMRKEQKESEIAFSEELGLACEKLPEGTTME